MADSGCACCANSAASPPIAARKSGAVSLAVLPAVGASLLAPVACPCCWATWGGILGAGSLGTFGQSRYILPLTALCLGIALAVLLAQARRRRAYGPLVLGALGAATVLVGKFALSLTIVTVAGAVLLLVAAMWNAWPRRSGSAAVPAPNCC
jgi:hypothetical protein